MFLLTKDYWKIKTTEKKGRGVFAKKDINPGTIIGDYLGRVLKTAEETIYEKDDELYLMYYHDRASIYPTDIKKPGIHLINHSCTPNCWMYTYRGHTLFFALRHIFAGEELTVSYLLSPLDKWCDPCIHNCMCGSFLCTKTMHLSEKRYDSWSEYHEKESSKTKRERIRYGQELPKLSDYPHQITDDPIYSLFGSPQEPSQRYDDQNLPTLGELRKRIRTTGKTLEFPHLHTRILGVVEDVIYQEPI